MDHISVVIVHYNTPQDTKECVRSLAAIKAKNYKYSVIVVDNGSKEALTLSQRYLDNNFEVIRSESNLGFTGGNNLGMYHAIEKYNSDYVLLLNSDTLVDAAFLDKLVACAKKNPRAGLICPKIYFAQGSEFHSESYTRAELGKVIWYGGGSIDWRNLLAFHRGVDEVDYGHFKKVEEVDFATGCCVLITREVLEKVGVFDKRYFLYLEDVDLSVRVKKAGYQVLLCPQAQIWHKNAGSSGGSGSLVQQYYQTRNRLLFALKHGTARVRLTALRLATRLVVQGTQLERRAVWHALTANFGKQPLM